MRRGLLVLALLGGCAPSTTYGYRYEVVQDFGGGEEPEPANVEARQLLAGAKTVAFYPPDQCVNATTVVENRQIQELRAHCGVLMSALERAAEGAGYEVYSWQNLRGGRAIDLARDAKVDVLFEVNEFQITGLTEDMVRRSMKFFEQADDGNETPLPVATSMAGQCDGYAKAHDKSMRLVAETGSIDIKTVNVADGRDRWHYRKTREKSFAKPSTRHTFTGPGKMHPLARAGLVVGGVLAAIGIEFIVLQNVLHEDPTPSMPNPKNSDFSPWSYLMVGVGTPIFAGGVYAALTLKSKPPVDKVLCAEQHADADRMVVQVGTLSAEHTFAETSAEQLSKEQFEALRDEMIGDFVKVLTEVHGAKR